jgi:hypothetical protein
MDHRKRVVTKQTLDVSNSCPPSSSRPPRQISPQRCDALCFAIPAKRRNSIDETNKVTPHIRILCPLRRERKIIMDHRKRVVTNRLLTSVTRAFPVLLVSPAKSFRKDPISPFLLPPETGGHKTDSCCPEENGLFFHRLPTSGTRIPFVFFLRKKKLDHRKRVVTKQTLDVRNSVFFPVNAGIESTMLTKGL